MHDCTMLYIANYDNMPHLIYIDSQAVYSISGETIDWSNCA